MLSKLEIEAYYIKIIGVTLVMTASCVSDSGLKQLSYEDVFRLVEGREIVLTSEVESCAQFSENSPVVYFHKPQKQVDDNSVLSQLAEFFQAGSEKENLLPHTLDWHNWQAFQCSVDEVDFHTFDSHQPCRWLCKLQEFAADLNEYPEVTLSPVFSGTNFKTRAGPSFLLS
ncbi:MAG: hypothetical protein JEZ14_06630 [Marinilabiliaceae bacterium]|nr:hypothetical protein [Marinilabiliaceae bacterium]